MYAYTNKARVLPIIVVYLILYRVLYFNVVLLLLLLCSRQKFSTIFNVYTTRCRYAGLEISRFSSDSLPGIGKILYRMENKRKDVQVQEKETR